MEIKQTDITARGIKFFVMENGAEVARAHLYLMANGLHTKPFGLMEDVFVDESLRGQGIGTELVQKLIEAAKDAGCYKLIATSRHSRPKVHELYEKLGFKNHGVEFRIDF
ncbi:MAG: GNAT family N-acetyltransferase [Patescibacteria group bacterium]|jgi:GNAT superfamily N-acetyltransferase